ncbi:unnamed protein product [Linum trigynum]|uniref:ABC transporter domain-containing protein n=1 Tax=Linum trigynum TaxID=586398 RepID=A0AAV2D6V0_9ROSI
MEMGEPSLFELEIDSFAGSGAETSSAARDDEDELILEAIARLPSEKRDRYAVQRRTPSEAQLGNGQLTETIDLHKLKKTDRELLVKKALATNSQDNFKLLSAIKSRLDRVGIEVTTVEVRFEELNVVASVQVGSRALPTLVNAARDAVEGLLTNLRIYRPKKHSLTILSGVSGILKPGRMALLLGPPGSGKSTLLKALAGKLDKNLKVTGSVLYNGQNFDKFYVRRTSAYISQIDNHIAELTVRETLDFAGRWQGQSEDLADMMKDLIRLEKERNIHPSPEIDAFMKAASVHGKKHNVATDYILRVLGIDVCADTLVGNDMLRGVSGGQKKRVTTGEMIVGPRKTLFMDEVSTGLDSSTTYQVIKCLRNFVHLREGTLLVALLQPPPETFDLFDDLILLSEGHVVYQGPRAQVLEFFESLGFKLPPQKGVADFLQEVTSKKDQGQYWADPSKPYVFISALEMAQAFKSSECGRSLASAMSVPYDKTKCHPKALPKTKYAASRWELLKTCFAREILLLSRHQFLYVFKTCQVALIGLVTCTIFTRTKLHPESCGLVGCCLLLSWLCSRNLERSAIGNDTVGHNILHNYSLPTDDDSYWIGVGVLFLYALFFNIIVTLALVLLHPLETAQAIAPIDAAEEINRNRVGTHEESGETSERGNRRKGMILPFQPLVLTFNDLSYFVDMPKEMRQQGEPEMRLQLLTNVSGVFSPGVLTALVGSSGAGKTTLMDVLAGRKTGGYINGDIKISGHPKVQSTFARISGYVEQNDIHSPQVTVEESLWFSSSLRLPNEVTKEQRHEFVEEVMRLGIANPSIIFMDEPTSGLDARAAAIVMRTVRNTVDTGRTVVCTIHQPSIDIFEAFDELLLMKRGGRVIYGGKLGLHSQIMIDYFQGISGVPPIPEGYNPATWMLEVTSTSVEETIKADFAELYRTSQQYREVEASIMSWSAPPPGSEPLHFASTHAQDSWSQFRICLKKQMLVYWRSPRYNAVRLFYTMIAALILGTEFWGIGSIRGTTQALSTVMGALYISCIFLGVSNATTVQPIVSIERTVFYREKAAGMYSPLAYAAAQGIVEIPYILAQTIVYCIITYFTISFEQDAAKFFLYLVFVFLTFTYFTFYGMMAVGITPTQNLASVISSAVYSLWYLFSGFLIPKQFIPVWWRWYYYICPTAWTLQGIISSQLGDVETMVRVQDFEYP